MPCGQNDRRLRRRRCVYCQREHAKCDGNRPCSTCLKRGVQCISSMPASGFSVVPYHHPSGHNLCLSTPLTDDDSKYVWIFFELVKCSATPFIQLFSYESIGDVVRSDEVVRNAVNLVGQAYAAQRTDLTNSSSSQLRHDSRALLPHLRTKVLMLLKRLSEQQRSTAALLSACLLGFAELFLYDSGSGWCSLIFQALSSLSISPGYGPENLSSLHSRLYRFLRTSGTFCAISFDRNVFWATRATSSIQNTLLSAPDILLYSRQNIEEHWEVMTEYLEEWGRLQYELRAWIEGSSTTFANSTEQSLTTQTDSVHILAGIELVNRASRLQQRIISVIIFYSTSDPAADFCRSFLPYYYWALTGLSQIFHDPSWLTLATPLPMMDELLAHEQAAQAFEYIESNMNSLRLGAIVYAPLLHIIGWQFSRVFERDRVLAVVKSLRSIGFSVANRVEKELQYKWARMGVL